MSDKQALRNAVDIAVKNGWKKPPEVEWWDWDYVVERGEWWPVIFRHDFAQKLWGDEPITESRVDELNYFHEPAWKHQLRQMVVADNPLQYLGEHLPQ